MRLAADYLVCLQPLGKHDVRLLRPISRGITQAYGFEVRALAASDLPSAAWYPPRSRYRARALLDYLRADVLPREPNCDAVIAITAVDISTPMGEHPDWGVLGLAYQGHRVGVVSSFRLGRNVDHRRVVERSVKVVLHELGHVIGLPHRNDGPACLMNDARGAVVTIDRATGSLCEPERAAASEVLDLPLPQRDGLDWDSILRP